MREIRIYCVHGATYDIPSMLRYIPFEGLDITKNFVWDKEKPEYILATDRIYIRPESAKDFLEISLRNPNSIRILFLREALYPDLNTFDYAVSFDKNFSCGDRCARISPYLSLKPDYDYLNAGYFIDNDLTFDNAKLLLQEKKRFCNFIYSNRHAYKYREGLFYALSDYKRIDSLGKYLNNVGTLLIGEGIKGIKSGSQWMYDGIKIKSHYKFSIAAENAVFNGYNSEKLFTSLCAHTVPIYCGNPSVTEDYNPEAFINCNDYKNYDEVVKRVKEIDEDDDLWAYIVSRPWQTEAQKETLKIEWENYKKFMTNIFTQPFEDAKRRPQGFNLDLYENSLIRSLKFRVPQDQTLSVLDALKKPALFAPLIMRRLRAIFFPMKRTNIDEFFND